MDVITKVVINEKLKPIFVTWEQGYVMNQETANNIRCEIWKKSNSEIMPVASIPENSNIFVGEKDQSSELCTDYLLLRNKKTNEIRMYSAENYFLSRFQKSDKDDSTQNVSFATTLNDFKTLNKEFGSRKIKRRIADIDKSKIYMEDMQEKLKDVLENAEEPTKSDVIPPMELNLPPCDRNAKSIEQAYKLYNIVSKEELNSVNSIAETIMANGPEDLSDLKDSASIKYLMKAIPKLNIETLKILLMVNALMDFLKAPYRKLFQKKPIICSYSGLINQKILDNFCIFTTEGRVRSASMEDKTISYIMVLLLIASEYTFDITGLENFINKNHYKRLPLLLQAIGAKSNKANKNQYTLQIPLSTLAESAQVGKLRISKRKR